MILLMSLMIITNFAFIYVTHPLSMGMMMIIQTFIIAFFSSMFMPSFWYSYILILVFLGGLLILFIYVSSLASNEQMNTTPPSFILSLVMVSFFILSWNFNPSKALMLIDNFQDSMTFLWMYSSSFIFLASFLIIYLFIVLVAIVKITKWWGGSLRPL